MALSNEQRDKYHAMRNAFDGVPLACLYNKQAGVTVMATYSDDVYCRHVVLTVAICGEADNYSKKRGFTICALRNLREGGITLEIPPYYLANANAQLALCDWLTDQAINLFPEVEYWKEFTP